MRQKNQRQRPEDLITASEIASFAYCPEAWRLEHGLGLEAGNRESRMAGDRHHARKSVAERVAGGAITLGQMLAALAAVAMLLLLWW
jgi:hypothetical protein